MQILPNAKFVNKFKL